MNDPIISDQDIERYTQHYLRVLKHTIDDLIQIGYERDDIAQEIRITVWRESSRYDPSRSALSLQTWLTYKVNYRLRTLKRNAMRNRV